MKIDRVTGRFINLNIEKGLQLGRREELVGGELIRSYVRHDGLARVASTGFFAIMSLLVIKEFIWSRRIRQYPNFVPMVTCLKGLYLASKTEVMFRFGSSSRRRRRLVLRIRRWIELARLIGGLRLLIYGSFVTAKAEPDDLDAVFLLPPDFQHQIEQGIEAALELEEMILTRCPEEIFATEDETDWNEWIEFFSRIRETDGRRKGLVEVKL